MGMTSIANLPPLPPIAPRRESDLVPMQRVESTSKSGDDSASSHGQQSAPDAEDKFTSGLQDDSLMLPEAETDSELSLDDAAPSAAVNFYA